MIANLSWRASALGGEPIVVAHALERGEARATEQQVSVLAHLTLDGRGTPATWPRRSDSSRNPDPRRCPAPGRRVDDPMLSIHSTVGPSCSTSPTRAVGSSAEDVCGRDVWLASVMGAELDCRRTRAVAVAGEL